jgi:hypothetical protein
MRYAVAGLFSLSVILGVIAFDWHTERSIKAFIRSQLEADDFPDSPEFAEIADALDSNKRAEPVFLGFGTTVPDHVVLKIKLGDIFRAYAVYLILFVCGVSLGIAHWLSPKATQQESRQ